MVDGRQHSKIPGWLPADQDTGSRQSRRQGEIAGLITGDERWRADGHLAKGQVPGSGASIRLAASAGPAKPPPSPGRPCPRYAPRAHRRPNPRSPIRPGSRGRAGRVVPSSLGDLSAAIVELGGQASALADLGAELTRARWRPACQWHLIETRSRVWPAVVLNAWTHRPNDG
jgi:hypothetical protein